MTFERRPIPDAVLPPPATSSLVTRRTAVLALGFLATACSEKPDGPCVSTPAKVLFICQAGTVKSAVARELFRRRAAARGVSVAVQSRGIAPEEHMTDKLLAATRADGIDPRSEPAQALTLADLRAADIVIYFNRPAEASDFPEALDWTDVPSMNDDYPGTRTMILERSEAVLDTLAAKPCRAQS